MPSLDEPLAKLERAKEHLTLIQAELSAYASGEPKPYRIVSNKVTNAEPRFTIEIVSVEITRRPPIRLGILVGEFVQSISDSLDYLAWQLSLLTKPDLDTLPDDKPPVTDISFPIFLKEPTGGIKGNKRLKFVPGKAREVIELLQPYKLTPTPDAPWVGPDDTYLWTLYRLNNRAKHRTINPIGLRLDISQIDQTGQVVSYSERVIPFDQDTSLGVIPDQGTLQISPSFDVLFSETNARESVSMETLSNLYDYIRGEVIPSFAGYFP